MSLALAIAVALAAGALVGGCGGDHRLSKSQYLHGLRWADRQAMIEAETNETGPSIAQKAAATAGGVAILRRRAANIEALKAPKDVEAAQRDYVAGIRAQADQLEGTLRRFYQSGDSKPLEARARVGEPSPDVADRQDRAFKEFEKKGYPVAASSF